MNELRELLTDTVVMEESLKCFKERQEGVVREQTEKLMRNQREIAEIMKEYAR